MNLDDVTHKTQLIPGGYTIEFSIPWGRGDQFRGIGWETGFIGKTIGVDVWNFDNDGSGRQSATSWRGNWENQWKGQWLGDVVLGGIGGDTEAPSIPANLSGVAGATKITLTWNTSTDNSAVAEYFIYQGNTRIAEVNASADPAQSFVVEGLAQNTAFSFRIKSVDESGNVSAFSNTLSITTLLDNVAPTAPANLSAQNITSTSADLSWNASTDNFGVTKYQVFRNAVQVGETTGTTFHATGLSPLTSYAFVVKALDEVGNISDASSTLTVVTPDHHITRAASAATSVVVDGTLDETVWQSATASEVTKRIEGTTDNQLSFKTAWDTQNLYVAATLLDADLYANAGQFWSTDALEVYIDANNSRDADYDADDRQFTRVINAGGTYGSGGATQAGVAHAWGTTTGGYTMEMSIPWTNLGITPTVGMTFAFDVGNNDDDNGGGRDGVLMWNGTGENWHNTRDFGKIVLMGPDTGRVVIQPTCTGNPAATRGWQLSSTYTTAKTVSWSVQGSALTGTVVIPAQGTYWLETQTQSGANQLTVTYGNALTVTKSNTGSSCTMTFTSMCSTNPAITRRWRVMSTYPVSVPFTWQVFGTAQTGSGTVAAGGLVYFETQTVPGANTTILSYDGKSLTKASGGQTCTDGNGAVLSVMSETSATKLSLYPNPSSSTVTVQLKERARGVSILTLMGNTMWQKESFVSDEEQVDVRAWAAGTYVVKVIYATGRVETQKLVVK
jgi:chitodextrinase